MLIPFHSPINQVNITPAGYGVDSTDLVSSYTFSGLSLSTEAATRIIVASIGLQDTGTSLTGASTVTIGGVSATKAVTGRNASGNTSVSEIWYASVPTGATGDVVITPNTTLAGGCCVTLYALYGATGVLDTGSAVGSAVLSDSLNAYAGCVCVAQTGEYDNSSLSDVWSFNVLTRYTEQECQSGEWYASGYGNIDAPKTVSATNAYWSSGPVCAAFAVFY